MNDFLTPLLTAWFDIIWRVTWQGTVVVLIALLIDYQWKSMPPAWRNWLWRFAFLKIAVAVVPLSIPLPLLPAAAEPAPSTVTSNYVDVPLSAKPLNASQASVPPLKLLLFSVWLIGLSACAISNWENGRQVRRKLQKSTPTQANSLLMQNVRAISRNLGLTVIPEVRLVPGSSSPCLLTRKKRSIILLPKQWLESCSMSELRVSLAHELAHMARGDLAWNRLIVWSRAVLFFHPLVWIAMRRYLLSQEVACDSSAIANTGGNRADFARLLVQLAEHATATPSVAVAMIGSTSSLKERIAAMYQAHYKPTRLIAWAVTALGVFGLMPFALAEQAEKSERTELTANKDANGPKVSASATSISRGSGSARGLGAGAGMGNGNGDGNTRGFGIGGAMTRSRSQSSGRTSVSINSNTPQKAQTPVTRPQASLADASSMKQSTSSGNRGGVATWTRTTEATLNGDNVTIVEKPSEISLTIEHADGTKEDFVATDLRDLARQSRAAAAVYRKLMTPVSTAGNSPGAFGNNPTAAANTIGGKPLNARDLLRDELQSMKSGQGSEDAMLDRLIGELDALGN
ncbi:M56 family metallopeptidase [Blastopirellula marina]|uniref:Peptidase M56 domain-containing protein n=1 Tax=Blastopirellula marina TaxID=124 RepID=A0A2S8FW73_9BACT|nr:M56 family metallopeptidase [Blastopirellula marina]PQO36427.1 hypothetical protein C5Y98_12040 [Blastopirellula marina]PTL44264.1 hypothetical protein C5Y97_12050 [Blastopirellula marina]